MEIAITVLLLIVGLVLIIKGGDFFVDAASWMAEASGIPKLIVGATVVSFATTLPELLVSIFAALDARAAEALSPGSGIGMVDMSIGNAIGSVTANLGLIMGIALGRHSYGDPPQRLHAQNDPHARGCRCRRMFLTV